MFWGGTPVWAVEKSTAGQKGPDDVTDARQQQKKFLWRHGRAFHHCCSLRWRPLRSNALFPEAAIGAARNVACNPEQDRIPGWKRPPQTEAAIFRARRRDLRKSRNDETVRLVFFNCPPPSRQPLASNGRAGAPWLASMVGSAADHKKLRRGGGLGRTLQLAKTCLRGATKATG